MTQAADCATSAGMDMLGHVAALCTTTGAGSGVVAGLFAAGMAGSVLHCAPMCGGFVLGQVADRMAQLPASQLCEWRRLSTGALLPYHLGRLTTYGLLGAVGAGSTAALVGAPLLRGLSAALLTLAALAFLMQAAAQLTPWGGLRAPSTLARRIVGVAGIARRVGRFPLGMALGLLPCGLVYGALLAAAASG